MTLHSAFQCASFHTFLYFPAGLPIYHSKPGSSSVIFLDFDGDSKKSGESAWGAYENSGYNPRGKPYDFDSVERKEIGLIWARVTEDYAPFDVDVTTEEPATFDAYTVHCAIVDRLDTNGNLWADGWSQYAGKPGRALYGALWSLLSQKASVRNPPALMPACLLCLLHSALGGVAYVDVIGYSYMGYYSPAFVFWNNLGGGVK